MLYVSLSVTKGDGFTYPLSSHAAPLSTHGPAETATEPPTAAAYAATCCQHPQVAYTPITRPSSPEPYAALKQNHGHVVSTLLLYGSTRHVMMKNLGVKHFRLSLEDTKQNNSKALVPREGRHSGS